MRNVLILIFCFTLQLSVCQVKPEPIHDCNEQISLSGFLIRIFKKSEVNKLQKSRLRRLRGRSFNVAIDMESNLIFVDGDSLTRLSSRIENSVGRSEVHLLCEGANMQILNEYLCKEVGCERKSLFSNTYYELKGKRDLCFQITRVTAIWNKLSVNKSEIGNLFYRQIKYTDPTIDNVVIYLMKNCISFTPNPVVNTDLIEVWKDIPSIWD